MNTREIVEIIQKQVPRNCLAKQSQKLSDDVLLLHNVFLFHTSVIKFISLNRLLAYFFASVFEEVEVWTWMLNKSSTSGRVA